MDDSELDLKPQLRKELAMMRPLKLVTSHGAGPKLAADAGGAEPAGTAADAAGAAADAAGASPAAAANAGGAASPDAAPVPEVRPCHVLQLL